MENEDLLNELLGELKLLNQTQKEISHIFKVLVRGEIEKRLSYIFEGSDEILIYQLSDGEKTTSDLTKYVGVSKMTISRLWQKWEELEIVETEGYRNPYRAKYSLEELALFFGKPPTNDVPQAEEKE